MFIVESNVIKKRKIFRFCSSAWFKKKDITKNLNSLLVSVSIRGGESIIFWRKKEIAIPF